VKANGFMSCGTLWANPIRIELLYATPRNVSTTPNGSSPLHDITTHLPEPLRREQPAGLATN